MTLQTGVQDHCYFKQALKQLSASSIALVLSQTGCTLLLAVARQTLNFNVEVSFLYSSESSATEVDEYAHGPEPV